MATYSQAGKFGPAAISGAPAGVPLRVQDASGSDALLYADASKNKTVGPIVQANDAGLVTFFADPGAYTVLWTGGSTTVTVTGGTGSFGALSSSAPHLASDRGYLGWTQPIYALSAGSALPTAGVLNLRRVRRVSAGNVTNIVAYVTGAGSALTAGQCFAALYTAAGSLVAQTADQASAWGSTGVKSMALAGGPLPIDAGDYYVGVWFNGTTGPSLLRSGSITNALTNAGLTAPNLETATANTGVTTTAPVTLGAQAVGVFEWWFALS